MLRYVARLPQALPEVQRVNGKEQPLSFDLQPAIDPDVLLEILIHAEKIDAVVVGGQALNVWAEFFSEAAGNELSKFAPYQSKDIDFLGDRDAARHLASLLKGKERFPDRDDFVTPNSAIVEFERGGTQYVIDFLGKVAGVEVKEIRETAITIDARYDGEHAVGIRVAHPLLVLKTRIAGLTILRRTDPGSIRQMNAAPVVCKAYLSQELDRLAGVLEPNRKQQHRVVTKQIEEFVRVAKNQDADHLFNTYGIDLLPQLNELADHPELHPVFAECQVRQPSSRHVLK